MRAAALAVPVAALVVAGCAAGPFGPRLLDDEPGRGFLRRLEGGP